LRKHTERFALRLKGEETVVGAFSGHDRELYAAVGIIRLGRGRIIISTLDIQGAIRENERASVTAKKILLNYLAYASISSKEKR
jgi:hypothetical protein